MNNIVIQSIIRGAYHYLTCIPGQDHDNFFPPTPPSTTTPLDHDGQAAFFYFPSWEPEGLRATFLPNFPEKSRKTNSII